MNDKLFGVIIVGKSDTSKKSKNTAEAQIGIHLPQQERTRFDDFVKEQNCSHRNALGLLLDNYEKSRDACDGATPIRLICYCESKYQGNSEVEAISFYATDRYEMDWTEHIISESLEEYLLEQGIYKGYSFELARKPELRLRHKLNVYYNNIELRYIVQECMTILQEGYYYDSETQMELHGYSPILDQQHCKVVKNFDDVIKHFGRFSSNEELKEIRRIIAVDRKVDEIGK